MNIGFVGMGKLGLPSALAIESKGHTVVGYDINPHISEYIKLRKIPYMEERVPELLANTAIRMLPLKDVLSQSDIVFVPVQTPHDPLYEGVTKLPKTTADFDYTYLKNACQSISHELDKLGEDKIVIIISTVLPGTIQNEIKPLLSKHVKLCYNPFFIAMGTTVSDFLHPEIVLFGVDDEYAVSKAKEFYRTITDAPFHEMSIINAELVKVNYNTYISMKINFANNLMEVCEKMRDQGADVDVIIDTLSDCKRRIISPSYMRGGMPDGGGCHPRDNIALADFARRHTLSNDIYTENMMVREHHIKWFADIIRSYKDLPKVIMGKAYKPGTNLTVGSPSIRLYNELVSSNENSSSTIVTNSPSPLSNDRLSSKTSSKDIPSTSVTIWDPYVDDSQLSIDKPALFFIGTRHEQFANFEYPGGSVVIDPFGYVNTREDITIVKIGRQNNEQMCQS